MITEDQSPIVEFLASPATHGVPRVERVETHSAFVFLAGGRAYKLKRAVRFDYLDFSTAERRRIFCHAEVRLNRRTAPSIYRGVVAVTRERDGSLALGGEGAPVDWVVEMNRFNEDAVLDRLAAAGRLELDVMPPLASAIADLHRIAESRPEHGGRAGMTWVIDGNAAGFDEFGAGILDGRDAQRVTALARETLDRCTALLERRRVAGFVRQCHGDLHLRNIVLLDGTPTLFDAVEFNDAIACTDVLYDLGFLLMDLWRRRLPRHANAVLNRYMSGTDDLEGLALLPLFLSCRAAVRAKTSATAATMQEGSRRAELHAAARAYLEMAERLLKPSRPSLVAIGGFSGSGKSTLALGLAPTLGAAPGALALRSDEIRKRLCGVAPLDRLGPEGYLPEVSARVYQTMGDRAKAALGGGHSVIVDGVFARPEDRQAIERVASDASAPFAGLWLDAPETVLIERARARRSDPSDADAAVIRQQRRQGAGAVEWMRLDATAAGDAVLEAAVARLRGWLNEEVGTAAAPMVPSI